MTKELTKKTSSGAPTEAELSVLANEGSKEAIEKLEAYLKAETDFEKKMQIEIALGECELFYYTPTNAREEEEFQLCELIRQKQISIDNMHIEIEKLEAQIARFNLEQKVHEKLLASRKDKQEEWKYYFMDDFAESDRKKMEELENDVVYSEAWITEAYKLIKTERYRSGIPARHLSHFDFGDSNYDYDMSGCDCCDNGCPGCDEANKDAGFVPSEIPF